MIAFFFFQIYRENVLLISFKFYLFIYLWLCWVLASVRGLSPVVARGGHSSSQCAGLSLSWPLPSWSTGSRRAGSAIVAHGPSCSTACGIFWDQGSNSCPLHWQADSQPLCHQGSPLMIAFDLPHISHPGELIYKDHWCCTLYLPIFPTILKIKITFMC